jgi:hypothetical protein
MKSIENDKTFDISFLRLANEANIHYIAEAILPKYSQGIKFFSYRDIDVSCLISEIIKYVNYKTSIFGTDRNTVVSEVAEPIVETFVLLFDIINFSNAKNDLEVKNLITNILNNVGETIGFEKTNDTDVISHLSNIGFDLNILNGFDNLVKEIFNINILKAFSEIIKMPVKDFIIKVDIIPLGWIDEKIRIGYML